MAPISSPIFSGGRCKEQALQVMLGPVTVIPIKVRFAYTYSKRGDQRQMQELRYTVREFLARDWRADVRLLDRELAGSHARAGFIEAAPSVLTGNPYRLTPGNCIGVIGLNPMWHADAEGEAEQTAAELRENRFDDYESRRAAYFDDGNPEYNWRHFSRLGNRIRRSPLGIAAADARSLFRDHAFVVDLLPWWSVNISGIAQENLAHNLEPIRAWRKVLTTFVSQLKPRLLLVHGTAFIHFAEQLLGIQTHEFHYAGTLRAFFGRTANSNIPVLIHGQVTAVHGPQTDQLYAQLIKSWRAAGEQAGEWTV